MHDEKSLTHRARSSHPVPTAQTRQTRQAVFRGKFKALLIGLAFTMPAFVILAVFHIWATIFNVWMSFTDWSLGGAHFIGFSNYRSLLPSHDFSNALLVTAYFVLGSVPLTIVLALPIAYALYFFLSRTKLYQLILFMPYVIPTVASSMVWGLMFSSSPGGLANWLFSLLGLPTQRWLTDPEGLFQLIMGPFGAHLPAGAQGPSVAMLILIAVRIWGMLGFTVVILLAGLTTINPEIVQAARIDGAGEMQILRRVIVPMLSPTILFVAVISFIFAVREFNTIYVLTGGGPVDTTDTLTMLMFRQFYQNNQLGLGATTATMIALVIMVLTVVQFRLGKKWVNYE